MSKTYKISYKTFLNERLNKVSFHGRRTYPLYVQVTFDRKSMFFKSSYFELFVKPQYTLFLQGLKVGPSLQQVIEKEHELVDFVIAKTEDDFSLDLFKEKYLYYGQDLCELMEPGFGDYLFTFFNDKGMPALATAIKEGGKVRMLYDIIRDLRIGLNKKLYDELVENSFYYAPPYFPLFTYMLESKRWPLLSLVVMEWENPAIRTQFENYMAKHYPTHDLGEVIKQVDRRVESLTNKQR